MYNLYTGNPLMGMTISSPNTSGKVLGPTDDFNYGGYVMSHYPNEIRNETLVGFKILMRDIQPPTNLADRVKHIQANEKQFANTNCMFRIAPVTMPNDWFLITLPVPKSQLNEQVLKLSYVINMLGMHFDIHRTPITEINVSGKSNMYDPMRTINSIVVPPGYKLLDNGTFMPGILKQVSPDHAVLRTKWELPNPEVLDDLKVLATTLSGAFQ